MKYEITSKKEFQIEAAKALLADGRPHSYAEIVQHIRSQAEGTVLEGRIDYGTGTWPWGSGTASRPCSRTCTRSF